MSLKQSHYFDCHKIILTVTTFIFSSPLIELRAALKTPKKKSISNYKKKKTKIKTNKKKKKKTTSKDTNLSLSLPITQQALLIK